MLKINPRNHIFKTAAAAAGLIALGWFGLIFGFISGSIIDQLINRLRPRRILKDFYLSPPAPNAPAARDSYSGKEFIEAAAIAAAWFLCLNDPVKFSLLAENTAKYFPAAPAGCTEILSGMKNADYRGAAAFFGANASLKQKEQFTAFLAACGMNPGLLQAVIDPAVRREDYILLGLSPGAAPEEIKRVYYSLASQFHPDAAGDLSPEQRQMAEDAFKRIKEAYERIKPGC